MTPYHQLGHKRDAALLRSLAASVIASESPPADALIVVTPYGEDTASVVGEHQLDGERTVALDTFFGLDQGRRSVLMCSVATQPKRSEERRVGKERVSMGRSRWSP